MNSTKQPFNPHSVWPSDFEPGSERDAFSNTGNCIHSIHSLWVSITDTTKLYGIIILMAVSLYYPLFLGLDTERALQGSLTSQAITEVFIDRIFLVSFTIMIPVLIDNFLDFYYYGTTIEAVERFALVGSMFATFSVQFAGSSSQHYPTIFCCTYQFQLFLWGSSVIVSIHRLLTALTFYRALVVVGLFYMGTCCNVYLLVNSDPYVQIAASVGTYTASAIFLGLYLYVHVILIKRWWSSGLSLREWTSTISDTEFSSIIVFNGGTTVALSAFLFIAIFGVGNGIENIPANFIFSYTLVMIIVNICISIVPGRLLKIQLIKLLFQLETKKTFVRYISHELRTPLNIVIMGLTLVETQVADHVSHDEVLSTVSDLKSPCQSCVALLNDMLTYEKLDAGLMEIEKSEEDSVEFLQKAIAPIRLIAAQKSVEFITATAPEVESVSIFIDEMKLGQVLANILTNAIKFTTTGGVVTLRASVTPTLDFLVVDVKDTGFGISKENQAKLFANVVQFHAKTQQGGGGSGLGLWISKRIMDLHEGHIKVFSEGEGRGSTFTIMIPAKPNDTAVPPLLQTSRRDLLDGSINVLSGKDAVIDDLSRRLTGIPDVEFTSKRAVEGIVKSKFAPKLFFHQPDQKLKNILITDDSKLNRKLIKKSLEYYGHYNCFEADDGTSALELVKASLETGDPVYDLITMDNIMTQVNGLEATKHIRKAGYRGIIIAVTGNVSKEDKEDFLDAGADAVMPKPLNSDFHAFVYDKLFGVASF